MDSHREQPSIVLATHAWLPRQQRDCGTKSMRAIRDKCSLGRSTPMYHMLAEGNLFYVWWAALKILLVELSRA